MTRTPFISGSWWGHRTRRALGVIPKHSRLWRASPSATKIPLLLEGMNRPIMHIEPDLLLKDWTRLCSRIKHRPLPGWLAWDFKRPHTDVVFYHLDGDEKNYYSFVSRRGNTLCFSGLVWNLPFDNWYTATMNTVLVKVEDIDRRVKHRFPFIPKRPWADLLQDRF